MKQPGLHSAHTAGHILKRANIQIYRHTRNVQMPQTVVEEVLLKALKKNSFLAKWSSSKVVMTVSKEILCQVKIAFRVFLKDPVCKNSQLANCWCFRMAADLTHIPKVSVFDHLMC